ncbi:MAG: aminoglycoside phosphotransferase family protein [Peptococcaceae bacterium]|nr:aminoglycoside phosphotransferase family protein [Peptococcaceae bacterium]
MLRERLLPILQKYINRKDFKSYMLLEGSSKISFLAQGEYNLNYLLQTSRGEFVLRINTASQMNLDNQIAYEFQALKLLQNSGVTPRPFYLDDSKKAVPYGLLVMDFLPGEPLDYRKDLLLAASTFAKIHSLEFGEEETDFLVKSDRPFTAIYQEAASLLNKYFSCSRADKGIKGILEKALLKAEDKIKEEEYLLQEPWRVVINTEVNSHNFIVNRGYDICHLIDWEKPIWGEPAQDISMFLIATTTMWKRNYVLGPAEEKAFVNKYLESLPEHPSKVTLDTRIEMFKFFNYLRAISWCAMAWTEYTEPGRQLVNMDTFEKIKAYIEPSFIKRSLLK